MPTRRSNKSTMGMGTTGVGNPPTSGTASARRRTRTRAGSTQGAARRPGASHDHLTVDEVLQNWQANGAISADELPNARKYVGLTFIAFGL